MPIYEDQLTKLWDKLMEWNKKDLVDTLMTYIPDDQVDYYLNEVD